MGDISTLVICLAILVLWVIVLFAILRVPGLLINIAKEIRKSREQSHNDTVALAEILSEMSNVSLDEE